MYHVHCHRCRTFRGLHVCVYLSVLGTVVDCENGWTASKPVWNVDSCGPKEPWRCISVSPGEYNWSTCAVAIGPVATVTIELVKIALFIAFCCAATKRYVWLWYAVAIGLQRTVRWRHLMQHIRHVTSVISPASPSSSAHTRRCVCSARFIQCSWNIERFLFFICVYLGNIVIIVVIIIIIAVTVIVHLECTCY